jgi:hypothetical protein
MTFSTVPPTEWVGLRGYRKLEAPERMSDQRRIYSPKMKAAGGVGASPIFARLGHRPRFYDGGVFLSNSCIMS